MDGCSFCASYEDLQYALGGIIYEDDLVSAHHYYQEGEPNYLGHLVLRTKRHVPGLAELTEAEGQAFGLAVTRHLHLLLTARYPGAPQEFWRWKIGDWPDAPKGGAKEVIALCDQLRAHLSI
jgi:histidine triad (HIT) family protein